MFYEVQNKTVMYLDYYRDFIVQWWGNIGPSEYGVILLITLVIGYALLKSANRR